VAALEGATDMATVFAHLAPHSSGR
jgi:hypothetical protein